MEQYTDAEVECASPGDNPNLAGGCLCGQVRYVARCQPDFAGFCYCRDCRRVSGTGRVPFLGVRSHSVDVTGRMAEHTKRGGTGKAISRFFCPKCGTRLFAKPQSAPDTMILYAGTLDNPSQFEPTIAIHLEARAPWEPLPVGLAQFRQDVDA
ncbi:MULTISPECIES: GFA family protein [Aminobacter]|uniref:GFA family protein n=1 Tax=Aminobacter TaxID=31988 RepID=UPI000A051F19|nr:aldehyde-activating protein [Aminobacter sp. MDW-2]QNH33850.1 GFA family protein [Aminobacter sp. MDW-2]